MRHTWTDINNSNDKFRLLCSDEKCSLSVCNLINGKLHITTIHGKNRHSMALNNEDMVFILSQFLNSLSPKDRENILKFSINNT